MIAVKKTTYLENDSIANYHGNEKKGNFFEGWYFKISDKEKNNPFAVILGIARSNERKFAHTFIQILTATNTYYYKDHNLGSFSGSKNRFYFKCQDSSFDGKVLKLNTDAVHGEIAFGYFTPFPSTFWQSGVMEWSKFVPWLGLKYGILDFNTNIYGELTIEGKRIDYDEGKGYIEKNWGSAFPDTYLWTQCNDFEESEVSVVASVAKIKYLGIVPLKITVIGVYIAGVLYKFTTASLSRLRKHIENDEVIELVSEKKEIKNYLSLFKKKKSIYL